MFKKFISVFMLIIMVFGLTACGKKEKNNDLETSNKELEASDLSIKDFKLETKLSDCEGNDCYVFSLTNNSKSDIIGVDITYKVKDNLTNNEQIIYNELMKYCKEASSCYPVSLQTKGENSDFDLITYAYEFVQKGEKLKDKKLHIFYNDRYYEEFPTAEQFELMEPKELTVGIVSNNKLYNALYDFQKKSWKLDEIYDVDVWPDKKLGIEVSKPNEKYYKHYIASPSMYGYDIYFYGATKDMYKNYAETLKSAGFTVNGYCLPDSEIDKQPNSEYCLKHDGTFWLEPFEGYEVTVEENKYLEVLVMHIFKEGTGIR